MREKEFRSMGVKLGKVVNRVRASFVTWVKRQLGQVEVGSVHGRGGPPGQRGWAMIPHVKDWGQCPSNPSSHLKGRLQNPREISYLCPEQMPSKSSGLSPAGLPRSRAQPTPTTAFLSKAPGLTGKVCTGQGWGHSRSHIPAYASPPTSTLQTDTVQDPIPTLRRLEHLSHHISWQCESFTGRLSEELLCENSEPFIKHI